MKLKHIYACSLILLMLIVSCSNPTASDINKSDNVSSNSQGEAGTDESSELTISDNFETSSDGSVPMSWVANGGTWTVVEDGSNKVIKGVSTSTAFLYRNDIHANDFTVEAKVKLTSNGYVGVLARYLDSKNYVALHFKSDGTFKLFIKYNNSELASNSYKLTTFTKDTYYSIKLVARGNEYSGYIDDVQYVSLTDTTPLAGSAGLYLYNDTVYADDIQIAYTGDGTLTTGTSSTNDDTSSDSGTNSSTDSSSSGTTTTVEL